MIKSFVLRKSRDREMPELGLTIGRLIYIYSEHPAANIYKKSLLNKILNIKVLTSCFFMLLGISQIALADYQPPKDQKPPVSHSDSSGVRIGCKTNDEPPSRIKPPVNMQQPNSFTPSTQQYQKKTR